MKRAYSVFQIKSVDEDARIIEGIATSPKTDRMGDIVESEGAEYTLPIPFLWQHQSSAPIGHVIKAKVSEDGITVQVQIEKFDEPGQLKDRLDLAWQSIKLGLVRGLSIGFQILEAADIKGTWGMRISKWSWLELSAVTIPANIDATIQTVKQFDESAAEPAASGNGVRTRAPAGSGPVILNKPKPQGKTMTVTERIAAFEAKRAANVARLNEIAEKCGTESRSKNESEREENENLGAEVRDIDLELKDLRDLEVLNKASAKPVEGTSPQTASKSRDTSVVVVHEKPEPGIRFARFAMVQFAAKGNAEMAINLMQTHYPQEVPAINVLKAARNAGRPVHKFISDLGEHRTKAAVAAHDTMDATSASPLVDYTTFAGDFLEYLRPRTIIGQFGLNGIPELRSVPFNVHIKGQTSGGTGYWVGEGAPKPVTAFDFNDTYHAWTKVAAISVLTDELIRFSNPSAERLVRDALSGCLIERIDSDVVDPTITATANVRPASLTNGVAAVPATGTTIAFFNADIADLWAPIDAANLPQDSAVYVTTPALARTMSLMRTALGAPEFPNLTARGGTLGGVPVIVSNYVDAGNLILVIASEVWLSDDGVVTVDASHEASIQMLDNPTNTPIGSTVATTLVSMFQTDSTALRAHRFINWSKRRSTAVQLITGAAYA